MELEMETEMRITWDDVDAPVDAMGCCQHPVMDLSDSQS